MTQLAPAGPNQKQVEYWNESSGSRWVTMGDIIDQQIEPLGAVAMDRAQIEVGKRVLDIGCGCGQTSLELAKRVGGDGSVLGLDISEPMLSRATDRAREAGLRNVEFQQADAQTEILSAETFDHLFSRFGVMFFDSPVAAFSNLRLALRPGGRLTFVAWRELGRNPWMLLPITAIAPFLPPADAPPDPHGPGPFAFAEQDRVVKILRDGGFKEITHENVEIDLLIGGGRALDETVDFLLNLGPAGAALANREPEIRRQAKEAIDQAIAPFAGPDGVRMPSSSWVVSAIRAK